MSFKDELASIHQNALANLCQTASEKEAHDPDLPFKQEAKKLLEEFIIPKLKETAATKPKLTRYGVRFNFYHYRQTQKGFVRSDLDIHDMPCPWHYKAICFAYDMAKFYEVEVSEYLDLFEFYIDLEKNQRPPVQKPTLEQASISELFSELAKRFQNTNFDIHAVKN